MPDQISVADFLAETWEDYNSPTTSNFVTRMGECKNTISALEEVCMFLLPVLCSTKPTTTTTTTSAILDCEICKNPPSFSDIMQAKPMYI